jgi:hypothetical protein
MIPQAAIDDYLSRPLDNHIWIKKLSREHLWAAVNQLRPKPVLYEKTFKHQLACFLLGVTYPQFSFWLDMGSGKTYLALALLQYWHQCGRLRRAVIFVTSDKAFPTWEAQVARYNIKVPYITLEGSSAQKWKQLDEFGDGLIFVTWPGFVALLTSSTKVKGKRKWKPDNKLVARFADRVDAFVMDESTRAGHDSLSNRLVRRLQKTVKIRYALAGRPFGRDPTMLWMQQSLIDKGASLGETLGLFRAAFFAEQDNPWNKYAKDYTFKKRMEKKLHTLLQHRSITYGEGECNDLPKVVPIIEEVRFPEEAGAYYKKAVQSIIKARGNMREVKNVFLRMRQLSSGFVGFKDDETGEKAEIEFADNPKFDRLMELLEDMPLDCKGVVF